MNSEEYIFHLWKKKMQLLLFILLALSGLPRRHVAMKDAERPQQ